MGQNTVGSLAGATYLGNISNSYSTGSVTGNGDIGGLVGYNTGNITNMYSISNVIGGLHVGGLVGLNNGNINNSHTEGSVSVFGGAVGGLIGENGGNIQNAYSASDVTGFFDTGGLIGREVGGGPISNVYSSGNVIGGSNTGGLIGLKLAPVPINNAYTTGNVSGTDNVGGLIGNGSSFISNTYVTGSVSGTNNVGGLVGFSLGGGFINTSYVVGSISGTTNVGGLVGGGTPLVTPFSFWNTETTGQLTSLGGGMGKTTAQMMQLGTFGAWSISGTGGSTAVWRIYDGYTYPLLRYWLDPLTVTADNINKSYDAVTVNTLTNPAYSIATAPTSGHFFNAGNPYGSAVNVGVYTPTGLYSDQQGYDIGLVNGILTISPAALNITANSTSKTYGQAVTFNGTEFSSSGLQNSETIGAVTLASTGAAATAGVSASPYAITASGASGGTFLASNYTISYTDGTLTVNPANLNVTANSTSKTYGQLLSFAGTEFTATGLQNSETISSVNLTSTGAIATANVLGSPYAITASNATGSNFLAGNYNITYTDGTLTVNPASLSITANNASKTYDSLAYTGGNGITYTGFVNGETSAVLGGTLAYTGTSQGAINAGAYPITPGGLTASNYTLNYADGTLTVNPAVLTYTANTATRIYGATNPVFTGAVAGFVGGDTQASATTGTLSFTSPATNTSNVGNYAINGSGLIANFGNYSFSQTANNNIALSITPASLSIVANNASKTYGQTLAFNGTEFSATGLQNGETIGSVGLASAGAAATAQVLGSPYSITTSNATGGTFLAGNYNISYTDGNLTVNPASLSITANNASKIYGQLLTFNGTEFSRGTVRILS